MRYQYACTKCGGAVHKPKVAMEDKKFLHGLHGWQCAKCGPAKVKRTLVPKSETP